MHDIRKRSMFSVHLFENSKNNVAILSPVYLVLSVQNSDHPVGIGQIGKSK